MRKFHGRTYRHTSGVIGVTNGLGDVFVVGTISPTGSCKRLKTPRLPPGNDPDLLQRRLDIWATERELEEVA